jgi:hypothetical protein
MKAYTPLSLAIAMIIGSVPLVYAQDMSKKETKSTATETVRLTTIKVESTEIADGPITGYHAKRSATGTKNFYGASSSALVSLHGNF